MKECQRVEKELTKVEMNLKINKHYLRDHERTMQDLRKSAQVGERILYEGPKPGL